jgi:hypothetical protein
MRTFIPIRSKSESAFPEIVNRFINRWEQPGWCFLMSLAIYTVFALLHGSLFKASQIPYFNYLADAFLHGQLYLRLIPSTTHDLVLFNGKYFLYWPPFPAIISIPFVALFGVGFSDILLTLFLGAGNVALVAAFLRAANRKGLLHLSETKRGLLVAFFAVGTVQFTLAPIGQVWFTAQEIGFLCVGLAYLAVVKLQGWKAFGLAGLAMACAMATRNHLILAGIWPAWFLLYQHRSLHWRKLLGFVLVGSFPVLIGGALLVAYNLARFGNPVDVGLDYHLMDLVFASDYQKYGAFNLHYLPTNFYYQYLNYPFPIRGDSFMGGSLFLLSPLFLAAFAGVWVQRKQLSTWLLVITILAVDIPILLLMGTGWVQFGPRYSLDFMLPLLILTSQGVQNWKDPPVFYLFLISFIHYLAGISILARA